MELISNKVHKKQLNVYSIARPHGLRGYIFLEADVYPNQVLTTNYYEFDSSVTASVNETGYIDS